MPTPPVDHPLVPLTQDVFTWGSWGLTVVLLGVAVRWGLRERTPFYVLIVLAAGVGAFAEPLYDAAMMLYFYSSPGMYTHFTAFGVPQPIWTHSGYVVLYASAAMAGARRIRAGRMTPRALFALAGVELAMSCAFEMIGINGGAYEYWGPHVFRVLSYPVVIGVLEAAQVVAFTVAAATLRDHVSSRTGLLGLFVLFPATFFMANLGAGAPVVIALHLAGTSPPVVGAATVLSMVFAAVVVRGAGLLLPGPDGESAQASWSSSSLSVADATARHVAPPALGVVRRGS
jgi:hypothetical protein